MLKLERAWERECVEPFPAGVRRAVRLTAPVTSDE